MEVNSSDEENIPLYILPKKKAKIKVKFIALTLPYLICESSPVEKEHLMQRCHVLSRHVTPEPTTRLPVCTSYPDTIGTHPATRGMSGPLRKNLCIHYASEHDPAMVGYRFLFGTTSDDTSCPFLSAIFYLMISILYLSGLVPYETHS